MGAVKWRPSGRKPPATRESRPSAHVARRVSVTGRVQGVNFRASCRRAAEPLGVTGWVRNLPDGTVEVWVEGTPGAVDDLVEWLATGPPRARVSAREIFEEEPAGHPSFEIRR
ncbi:acylphosphatase [Ruania halotolerans]|uniref:acylphosphatase n=1 Tax=Ruania halotolerans TaxID=2897773 RepID=UPI001E46ACAB|nr:acylphosphatase [Ruania halotolerans]UFU07807.1 acylphosphatase [Ruania halotolerans]